MTAHDIATLAVTSVEPPAGREKQVFEDESVQAIMRRWEQPNQYLGPSDYLAFARERAVYEKAMVERLKLTVD